LLKDQDAEVQEWSRATRRKPMQPTVRVETVRNDQGHIDVVESHPAEEEIDDLEIIATARIETRSAVGVSWLDLIEQVKGMKPTKKQRKQVEAGQLDLFSVPSKSQASLFELEAA